MKYRYVGLDAREVPELGLAVAPGDEVDLPDGARLSPRLWQPATAPKKAPAKKAPAKKAKPEPETEAATPATDDTAQEG